MDTVPLQARDGHVFIELGDELWLCDTGAPTSFGGSDNIAIAGEQFTLDASYFGLTADTLSEFVGVQCAGLLGADVLGNFDHIFDTGGGRLTVSTGELEHSGRNVHLDEFMGIPIVTVQIAGRDHRMFFDTGAQFSYFHDESLGEFPAAGRVTDFYPGVGEFETVTHDVPILLGGVSFTLQCGELPPLLAMTLMMASTNGIVGNAILDNRVVGYFPRRHMMVL